MTGQQMPSLTAKLQQRQREQLAEVERLTSEQLQQLARTLTQQCNDALSTTERVIAEQSQSLSGLQSEFQTTRQALQRTLSEARNTAERSLLSHLEQEQLKQQLHDQLKVAHSEAVAGQLTPLKRELQAINREAQNLSKTTFRGWLKPLLIGASVAIGVILATVAGTLTLDSVIASRAATLSELNLQIESARATASRLPVNAQVMTIEGRTYIASPTLGPRQTLSDGRYAAALTE